MRHQFPANYIAWRFYLVIIFIWLAIFGLFWRVMDLAIFDQGFLRTQGDERALRLVERHGFRGLITDRNGMPFAVSTVMYSIWGNPKEFQPNTEEIKNLSALLGIKTSDIQKALKLNEKKPREFVYLKRVIPPSVAQQIKALKIPGIYTQEVYKRFYPEGEAAAQLVGFTNVDDQGQEGLELGFNQWLQGTPEKKWVIKDRLGQIISEVKTVEELKPGSNLVLSVDRRLQYLAYRELMNGVEANKASSGSVVILDVKTGEILAMVNYPSFNPNRSIGKSRDFVRNRAVTDLFEPGSTIKAFSIASALDSGKYKPDTIIDTYPGWTRVGKHLVVDEHNNKPLSVTEILQVSSNVGVTKLILSLPPDQLWNLLNRVGFGEATGVTFPGEQGGVLIKQHPWDPFALATLSFGYGISVTTLQLARAYSILANNGIKLPISLLRVESPPEGEQVMSPKLAKLMLGLLESVVSKGGTGELASVPGYHIAGKTGTARIAGPHGYERNYVSSFVGIAPVSDPRLVVAVVIHDPKGKHYLGGSVSGPVFEKIMEGTLRTLNIPPDEEVNS